VVVHAVPLAEELIDDFPVGDRALGTAAAGSEEGVGFVDEDDAGGGELFGKCEDGFYVLLALADVHVVDASSTNLGNNGAALLGHRLGEESLASTRRPIDEQARDLIRC